MGLSTDLVVVAAAPPSGTEGDNLDLQGIEEGEIIEANEYEDISSDEEFNLRQRIEELEARNLELEKIASISKTIDYDVGYGGGGGGSGSMKCISLVDDDDEDYSPNYHRSSIYIEDSDYISSHHTKSSRKSNRSSRSSRKVHSSSHRGTKELKMCKHTRRKEKSKKHSSSTHCGELRGGGTSKVHRSSTKHNNISNTTTTRLKKSSTLYSSSEEDCILDRNELRAALKRDIPTSRKSSLKSKLKGVQKCVERFIDIDSKSRDKLKPDDLTTDLEILKLLDTLTDNSSKKNNQIIKLPSDSEDESISLEEQELRLIALKSAIVKKHEARQKRKIIAARPYSPTDDDIVMNDHPQIGAKMSKLEIRIPEENMEISPAVSPAIIVDKSLQPVDMDLVSSDCSKSPINYTLDNDSQTMLQSINGWSESAAKDIPLPPDKKPFPLMANDISNYGMFRHTPLENGDVPQHIDDDLCIVENKPEHPIVIQDDSESESSNQSSSSSSSQDDEEENALRALLLAKLNTSRIKKAKLAAPPIKTHDVPVTTVATAAKKSPNETDISLEADHLRSLLLASINRKVTTSAAAVNNEKENIEKNVTKPTINLKEVAKRFKDKSIQNKKLENIENIPESSKVNQPSEMLPLASPKTVDFVLPKSNNNLSALPNGTILPNPTKEPIVQKLPAEIPKPKPLPLTNLPDKFVESKTIPSALPNNKRKAQIETALKQPPIVEVVAKKTQNSVTLPTVAKKSKLDTQPTVDAAIKSKKEVTQGSKVITTVNAKTVKNLIINLQESDSDTDDQQNYEYLLRNMTNIDYIDTFNIASPASLAMDSPMHSPCSPIEGSSNDTSNTGTMATFNIAADTTPASMAANTATAPPQAINAFQQKLDEYLKSARTKVEQAKAEIKAAEVVKNKNAPTTPLVVRHLPPSAQLEYRRLINRMGMLEKQKTAKQQTNNSKIQNITSKTISVTIVNDGATVVEQPAAAVAAANTKKSELSVMLQKIPNRIVQTNASPSVVNVAQPAKSESLVKKIMVKKVSEMVQRLEENKIDSFDKVAQPNVEIQKSDQTDRRSLVSSRVNKISKNCDSSNKVPLKNLATMSEDEKLRLLNTSETDYTLHSSTFLNELDSMCSLVCAAQSEKDKQLRLEQEMSELKAKMQQLEGAIFTQKAKISKIYPTISNLHKSILNNRSQSMSLGSCCRKIGKIVRGSDYKIPNDIKDVIFDKLKEISCETKKLKNMKSISKDEPPVTTTTDLPAEQSIAPTLDDNNSNLVQEREKNIAIDANLSQHSIKDETKKAEELVVDKIEEAKSDRIGEPMEEIEETKPNVNLVENTKAVDQVPNVEEKTVDSRVEETLQALSDLTRPVDANIETEPKAVAEIVPDEKPKDTIGSTEAKPTACDSKDATKIGQYRSPLGYMNQASSSNPDAVLCPFELMGQCDDKECSYQHLTISGGGAGIIVETKSTVV